MNKKVIMVVAFGDKKYLLDDMNEYLGPMMVLYRFRDINTKTDLQHLFDDVFDTVIIINDDNYKDFVKEAYEHYKDIKHTFIFDNKPNNEYKNVIVYDHLERDLFGFLELNSYQGLIDVDANDVEKILSGGSGYISSFHGDDLETTMFSAIMTLSEKGIYVKDFNDALVCYNICDRNTKLKDIDKSISMLTRDSNIKITYCNKMNDENFNSVTIILGGRKNEIRN